MSLTSFFEFELEKRGFPIARQVLAFLKAGQVHVMLEKIVSSISSKNMYHRSTVTIMLLERTLRAGGKKHLLCGAQASAFVLEPGCVPNNNQTR
jgi:hypothetical protein